MIDLVENSNNFSQNSRIVAEKLLDMLANSYNKGFLRLGNNVTNVFEEKEAFFSLGDSFEEIVYLKKTNAEYSMSYYIQLETHDNDTPTVLNIGIDESLAKEKLPKEMLDALNDKFYNLLASKFN